MIRLAHSAVSIRIPLRDDIAGMRWGCFFARIRSVRAVMRRSPRALARSPGKFAAGAVTRRGERVIIFDKPLFLLSSVAHPD
jgi:hypothetical protein